MSTKTMNTLEIPRQMLRSPEIGEKNQDFYKACNEDRVLDKKIQELLLLTLASAHAALSYTLKPFPKQVVQRKK